MMLLTISIMLTMIIKAEANHYTQTAKGATIKADRLNNRSSDASIYTNNEENVASMARREEGAT